MSQISWLHLLRHDGMTEATCLSSNINTITLLYNIG